MADRNQKKSSGNKLCINDLLYNFIVQHLLFSIFLSALQENHCYVALFRQAPFHCIIKILVGACMSGFSMCKGVFNFEH